MDTIFTLITTDSKSSFQIPESLLRSVAPFMAAMCAAGSKECRKGVYHFKEEVLESTLSAFVNWAHKRDYPDVQPVEGDERNSNELYDDKVSFATRVLQWHLTIYIFGGSYNIRGLQDHAGVKLFDELRYIEDLTSTYLGEAVIDLLDRSFNNLPESDPLLPHLASFANSQLEYLKLYGERFDRLLGTAGGTFAKHLSRLIYSDERTYT